MSFLVPSARIDRAERIDDESPSEADFAATFRDVARVNRYLGGTQAVLQAAGPMLQAVAQTGRAPRILDIATGSADVPRALVQAAKSGRFGAAVAQTGVEIVATDLHPKVVALAARETPANLYPQIRVERADAFALAFGDGHFDVALCSLAFHHFSGPTDCVRVLREMDRVTGTGFVVNDLLRDRLACGLIWGLTRVIPTHPFTRHDAPVSVLKAYTLAEYRQMVVDAHLSGPCSVRAVPMYRAVIACRKQR